MPALKAFPMEETSSLPEFVLQVLRCPKTHSSLRIAAPSELTRLNQAIEVGQLYNELGQRIEERLDGALLNQDHSLAYPIRLSIPVMLADEAIAMNQLDVDSRDVERIE